MFLRLIQLWSLDQLFVKPFFSFNDFILEYWHFFYLRAKHVFVVVYFNCKSSFDSLFPKCWKVWSLFKPLNKLKTIKTSSINLVSSYFYSSITLVLVNFSKVWAEKSRPFDEVACYVIENPVSKQEKCRRLFSWKTFGE